MTILCDDYYDQYNRGPDYRQCKLEKPTHLGKQGQVSWIPDQFAKVGKVIKLRCPDGTWDDGWKVIETYGKKDAFSLDFMANQMSPYFYHEGF